MLSQNGTAYPWYREPGPGPPLAWKIFYPIFLIAGVPGFVAVILAVTRQHFWGRYPGIGIYIVAISVSRVFYLVVVFGGYRFVELTHPHGYLHSQMKAFWLRLLLPIFHRICLACIVLLLTFGLVDC